VTVVSLESTVKFGAKGLQADKNESAARPKKACLTNIEIKAFNLLIQSSKPLIINELRKQAQLLTPFRA
jgi:hypothetical protein